MFEMDRFWERVFYLATYIFQGSSYLSPRGYAVLHRMHHAYSDTERDPHSPHNHNNIFGMMWEARNVYNNIIDYKILAEERFSRDIPEIKWLDRLGESRWSRAAWALLYIGFYIAFATHWWMYLLIPIHIAMGAVHGAIVNWCGYKMGYVNFDNNDKSRNTLIFDFLMLGELFQNNHHKNYKRSNFGSRWYEFDPVYPFIKLFGKLKIIRLTNVNNVPAHL